MTKEKAPINWVNSIFLVSTPLLAAIFIPLYAVNVGFTLYEWAWFAFYMAATGMAITAGYHRLWSHKAYKAHFAVRLWHAVWGAASCQNSILNWSCDHRVHHRHVDDGEKDPYAASRGFWYSHIGWILRHHPRHCDDYSNVKDLRRDPLVMWQHRNYWLLALVTNGAVPLALGFAVGRPLGVFLLAFLLRVVLNHHFTFFINSLAHIWGRRPYSDEDTSRDNLLLALFTYGEGYHNFHHSFQYDYRNGIRWWQFDPSKWIIKSFSYIGLTKDLREASKLQIEKKKARMQLKRALARMETGAESTHRFKAALEARHEQLVNALNEWSGARKKWYAVKRAAMVERLERAEVRNRYLELKYALKAQRLQWRALLAELATA
ncbi:MAG: fatty acid desaturase [Acidobacteriota bacterium]|nr:fatty acid desaturase [Acidobacteriota bacterium]